MAQFRPTPLLLALAAGVALVLFAVVFFLAGGGASDKPAKPSGEVLVAAPAAAKIAKLRPIGSLPPAPAPRKPKKKKTTPARSPAAPATVTPPPAAVTPPSVVVRPPPPPPPPPPPECVGAFC
jgi:hypothetical protein